MMSSARQARRTGRWLLGACVALSASAGCSTEAEDGRRASKLWTLLDLQPLAAANATVGPDKDFPKGIPATYAITPGAGQNGHDALTLSVDLMEGMTAVTATPELWQNVDEVWVQPLYRATRNGQVIREVGVPWVFGVGPDSAFYSPYWQTYGFEVPDGVDPASLLTARDIITTANANGGFKLLNQRITVAAPSTVDVAAGEPETHYAGDSAWWDGGWRRYIDFGRGGFTADANGVVQEIPFFAFRKPGADGTFVPANEVSGSPARHVAGVRPFGAPPSEWTIPTNGDRPGFGGLWRLYWVEVAGDATREDGDGLPVWGDDGTLASQAAIEALPAGRIHRTEVLANCPLLRWGDNQFFAEPPPLQPAPAQEAR